jgi:hypothetical protein
VDGAARALGGQLSIAWITRFCREPRCKSTTIFLRPIAFGDNVLRANIPAKERLYGERWLTIAVRGPHRSAEVGWRQQLTTDSFRRAYRALNSGADRGIRGQLHFALR